MWNAVEKMSGQALRFILTIVIARLVSPADFGLIAMLSIFLSVAQSFIDCGFLQRSGSETGSDRS